MLRPYVDLALRRVHSLFNSQATVAPGRARKLSNLLPLCKVWVGPGYLKDLSAVSAETFLINRGYPNVPIEKSNIPYRVLSN